MCTYNITINDTLVEKARPAFADDMVKESLLTAFDELHSGKAKKNARGLLSIYDKSEIDNVSDAYLRQLVDEVENKEE